MFLRNAAWLSRQHEVISQKINLKAYLLRSPYTTSLQANSCSSQTP
jgi:hypothetical protein